MKRITVEITLDEKAPARLYYDVLAELKEPDPYFQYRVIRAENTDN